ncbi:hypothetical protein C0993_002259 [Termitomyces sp. T159_Od127]|nr:hypothetical protein C0993_002259 [Termitomyces sp. T159_Od127]
MDAFGLAIAAYSQHLNAAELAHIKRPTSLSALVAQAQTMGKTLVEDSKKPSILHILADKAALLEPFEALIQGFCQATPAAGDLIWGSVSFLLEMLKSNDAAFKKVLVFFQTMADEVGYIRLHEDAFVRSILVKSVVESLYKAILAFWVEAVKYYRSRHSGLRRRLKMLALSSSIDKKFQVLTDSIAKERTRLHEVSSAQHSTNSALFYEESHRYQRNANRIQLKGWLDAPDYEAEFRAADDRRYEGTCDWIKKKQAFVEWTSTAYTPSLFVHGTPGSGKTVLSSWVVRSRATEDELVLYHFFKDMDTLKRSPLSAIRSLVDQLFDQLRSADHSLLPKLESMLDDASQHSRHVHFDDLWHIFSKFLMDPADPPAKRSALSITVVLDALDECDSPQTLIVHLAQLANDAQGKVKIFMTGRHSAMNLVARSLPTSSYQLLELEITLDDVQQDIQAFVQFTISSVPRLMKHESLRDRLSEEIGSADNHRGMFLWVYFMCEEVKRQGDIRALQRLLFHLPKGLDAMYARICEGILERDEFIGLCRSVLQWIVHSPRPLQFSELQEGLRWMRPGLDNGTLEQEEWFDSETDLLWSREDIVDACGNLVIYSGINQGDCFMLVHLSATQFFRRNTTNSRHFANVKSFIEDIKMAQPTLGILCLEYLLSDVLRSDEYLAPSVSVWGVSSRVDPVSDFDGFAHRHPLFDFVVSSWLDLFFVSLSSGRPLDVGLLTRVSVFISDTFSSIWLEHFIRQSSIEVVIYTLRRFKQFDIGDQPELIEFMSWTQQVINVLCTFMQTLSRRPELVRTCYGTAKSISKHPRTWQMIHDNKEGLVVHEYPPLEAVSRAWVHYNSNKDIIFSVEAFSENIRLKSQIMTTGVPMKPALVNTSEDQNTGMSFVFHSAAVSPNSTMVAIAFYGHCKNNHTLSIVCWRLPYSNMLMNPRTGADVAFYNCIKLTHPIDWDATNHYATNVSANIIAFRGEDALVTPTGIWDLKKGEWLCGPATFFEQGLALHTAGYVSFSGNGEFAAQLKSSHSECNDGFNEIKVLNTRNGMPVGQIDLLDANKLSLQAFSYLGQKIIILDEYWGKHRLPLGLRRVYDLCLCLLVHQRSFIALDIPYHIHGLDFPQFTTDEDTFVASFSGLYQHEVSASIAVWRFTKDKNGLYLDRASMTHLFKFWEANHAFCLVPGPHQSSGTSDVMIIKPNGTITRRAIDAVWSAMDERNLGESPAQKFTVVDISPETKVLNMKTFSRAGIT